MSLIRFIVTIPKCYALHKRICFFYPFLKLYCFLRGQFCRGGCSSLSTWELTRSGEPTNGYPTLESFPLHEHTVH